MYGACVCACDKINRTEGTGRSGSPEVAGGWANEREGGEYTITSWELSQERV